MWLYHLVLVNDFLIGMFSSYIIGILGTKAIWSVFMEEYLEVLNPAELSAIYQATYDITLVLRVKVHHVTEISKDIYFDKHWIVQITHKSHNAKLLVGPSQSSMLHVSNAKQF